MLIRNEAYCVCRARRLSKGTITLFTLYTLDFRLDENLWTMQI
jgi:hypothetical protein